MPQYFRDQRGASVVTGALCWGRRLSRKQHTVRAMQGGGGRLGILTTKVPLHRASRDAVQVNPCKVQSKRVVTVNQHSVGNWFARVCKFARAPPPPMPMAWNGPGRWAGRGAGACQLAVVRLRFQAPWEIQGDQSTERNATCAKRSDGEGSNAGCAVM